MWVVLQPKVCLLERYWDMQPSCSEASALADVGDGSEVFFALLLRLMYWFVGSSGDGIDDVNPAAGGSLACPFWYLPRFEFRRWG